MSNIDFKYLTWVLLFQLKISLKILPSAAHLCKHVLSIKKIVLIYLEADDQEEFRLRTMTN